MTDQNSSDQLRELRMLSSKLLRGFVSENEAGLPQHKYLSEDEEDEGRRALAALLNSGNPPQEFLRLLAEMLAPNKKGELENERKLVFRFRYAGQRPDVYRDSHIAMEVEFRLQEGASVEEAISAVATELFPDDCGLKKEETVRRLWKRHRPNIQG